MRELSNHEVRFVAGGDSGDAAVAGAVAGGTLGYAVFNGARFGATMGGFAGPVGALGGAMIGAGAGWAIYKIYAN